MSRLALWVATVWMTITIGTPSRLFAEERPSADYDFYMTQGTTFFNRKAYDHAVASFRSALAAHPNDPRAAFFLGLSEAKGGAYAAAESDLLFALDLNSQKEKDGIYRALGEVYLKQEKYAQAAEVLGKIADGDDPLTIYYRGLARKGLKDDRTATPLLEQAVRLAEAKNLDWLEAARYHLGISQYRVSQREEAKESFSDVVARAPGSHRANQSALFLKRIENDLTLAREARRLHVLGLAVSAGLQYDTNATLEPSVGGIIQSVGRKKDNRFFLQVDADYKRHPTSAWGVGYGFYQTLHLRNDQTTHVHGVLKNVNLNLQSHEPRFFLIYDQERLQTRLDYMLNYTEVGESHYVTSHTLRPSLTIVHQPTLSTQLHYQANYHQYKVASFFPDNKERTGVNHALGATEYFYFAQGKRYVSVGYLYDQEDAKGDDWDAVGHQFLLAGEAELSSNLRARVNADYTQRDYPHPNSFVLPQQIERDDRIYTLSGRLGHPIFAGVEIAVQYTYLHNDSNLAIFDYNRSIYSVLVSGRL